MDSSLSPPSRSQDNTRRPKRRKIAVACDECRARKVRCDGIQPVCGPCSKRADSGVQCRYTGEPEKKRAVRNYISSLESRIKHLDGPGYIPGFAELNAFRGQVPQTASLSKSLPSSGTPASALFTSQPSPVLHRQPRTSISSATNADQRSPICSICQDTPGSNSNCMHKNSHSNRLATESNGDCLDGVNAMMGAMEEERPTQGFFGSSSAASFMRQIKTAVDKRVLSPHQHTSESALGMRPSSSLMSTQKERQSAIHDYVLPPRKTADSLMDVYWHAVFPLYPLVDSIHLREEYKRIWTGEALQSDENMLMCTFNVIFALACQLADFISPEEREASAAAFFSRAKDLLHFNLWDSGSAGLIQCLLLMAQYLQSTDSAHQCWIVTGLAIRNAQSMGLHLPQTIARLQSPQDQQLARKIWHGCVLMDRVISMTFGRPAMISKASCGSVPLPATIDEEYIASAPGVEASQPADQPSMMAFYAKSLELYEILNDVLLSLYKPAPEESPEDIYDFYFNRETSEAELTVFELDRALTKWTRSLPPHLRGAPASGSDNTIFYRQSVVLRARFLHVRMLLFRPILSKYCTARDIASDPLISLNDSFPQRVALQCSTICVKVAQEVIELIYSNIPSDGTSGPLPAWWYNILYVYTAATVLIASRLCPAILQEVTETATTRSWNCALEILRKYQSYSTSARRCVAALEILYERVISEANDQPEPHVPAGAGAGAPLNSNANANTIGDMSLGEGMNAVFLDSFDFADFQDMSWLNSVPSHLY
ncbi:fungal-specific transcription factor domain-containing protein [Aspergillus cavernicola]|uniref:Fungal-specific transcription factor domain-containing protein n=1 Tax=Aspergillus cavernicola TaxID=176166 RepID=A0ABR4HZK5_9EURO